MTPTDWSAFLNSNLLSGFLGALMGGAATLCATAWTQHHLEVLRKRDENQRVEAFCKAISAEISAIWTRYVATIGAYIAGLPADQPFLFRYVAEERYFSVFESNADVLGHIWDDDLRKRIVRLYVDIKGLLDTFKNNNRMIERFEHESGPAAVLEGRDLRLQAAKAELVRYVPSLKANQLKLFAQVETLVRDLENYKQK